MKFKIRSNQICWTLYGIFRKEMLVKREFKQWWSTVPPISTRRTTTSQLKSQNTKKHNVRCWKCRCCLV